KKFHVIKESDGSTFQVSIRRDKDWFAASGTLKVDDELTIDMMKLLELTELSNSRFIELNDGQYLALTDEFRRRIAELNAFADVRKNVVRFPRVRAAAIEDVAEGFDLKTDKEWKSYVQRLHESNSLVTEVPSTFQGDLRDYQREGFQWLCRLAHWGVGACLADDMGLGKTIQAITLLLHRAADGPALIVAPTSVAFNWLNEIQRFAPTLNARIFGGGDREAFLQELGPRDVIITSYGLLYNEAERFQARSWHTAILDEAQAIKNMATKRSQAAMGLEVDFRVILTGTPLENHLGELWNLFQFINAGLLGSFKEFQDRFSNPIERDQDRAARWHLKKLIQPFILRRNKTQVLQELPSRTEITLQVELSPEEAAFYEALRIRAIEKLSKSDDAEGKDNSGSHLKILAEIMRLRRACCHPKLAAEGSVIPSSKSALFLETLEELLDNRHKVLVFSQFVDHLTILREALDLKGISYQYLDGSTPAKQRKVRVEAFQAGEGDVFLISLKAGGLGLNLTAADYVMHMDPWWNPAVEDQASDRAHRLGQTRPVTIYRFVTKGTIEEQIVDLHRTKRDLADSLLEGSDMSGKLSAEALLKLIRE
ncbi:MAG: DEAD/DEAH box helicase, partial [Planctomycetota bacterium]